jgi:hypothetical protein
MSLSARRMDINHCICHGSIPQDNLRDAGHCACRMSSDNTDVLGEAPVRITQMLVCALMSGSLAIIFYSHHLLLQPSGSPLRSFRLHFRCSIHEHPVSSASRRDRNEPGNSCPGAIPIAIGSTRVAAETLSVCCYDSSASSPSCLFNSYRLPATV